MNSRHYFVYIMANTRPTLYVGVTNNLYRRVLEHKNNEIEGFTKTYRLHKLVYFEMCEYINDALAREKQIKHWERAWKLNLIKNSNPNLMDLFAQITDWT